MPDDIMLAPAPDMVRYLAIFHRAFTVCAGYKENKDPYEAVLGGELADALHNVPSLLWSYRESKEWNSPSQMDAWVRHEVVAGLQKYGAPERIIALCSRVVSPEGTAAVFGLRDDLSDLHLAPQDTLDRCLTVLRQACLTLRVMRNFDNDGDTSVPRNKREYAPWRDLETVWTSEADTWGLFCAYLAQALLRVIAGIVHWKTFDEDAWLQEARTVKALVPEQFRDAWEAQLKPWVFSVNLPSPVV